MFVAFMVKIRQNLGRNSKLRHEKCTLQPPMKGLAKKSINGSAESQFAFQENVDSIRKIVQNLDPKSATSCTESGMIHVIEVVK